MARKDVINGIISADMTDANDNFIELYTELEAARDGETTLLAKEQAQDAAILAAIGGTSSLVSAADTTNGFLFDKIKSADGSIAFAITSPAGNEKLDLSVRGGATTTSSAVDVTLTAASTVTQYLSMTAADKFCILPDATTMREGDYFQFFNDGSYRYGIKGSAGIFIASIEAKGMGKITLIDNSTAAGTWKASDGADLLMMRLQTVLNADGATSNIQACKMTATTVFAAWSGTGSDGFCTMIKIGATLTQSNILEFDTTNGTSPSVCRMTDTVAVIGYVGTDDDGFAVAITYNGTDTVSAGTPFEFKDATTIYALTVCPIYPHATTGRFAVIYHAGSATTVSAQVLNLNVATITLNTAEANSADLAYAQTQFSSTLLAGTLTTGEIVFSYYRSTANATYAMKLSWTGGNTLTFSSADTLGDYGTYSSVAALDADYFVAAFMTGAADGATHQLRLALFTSALIKKNIITLALSSATINLRVKSIALISPGVLCLVVDPTSDGVSHVYKINAVGATTGLNSVLRVDSEINTGYLGGSAGYKNIVGFDANAALYLNTGASGYLEAERIDIA